VRTDGKFVGLFVLRTNMDLSAPLVVLRYRNLLAVEQRFLPSKTLQSDGDGGGPVNGV